jgi:hypothetical protein
MATSTLYYPGSSIRLRAQFYTDNDTVPTDPSSLYCEIKDPTGSVTTTWYQLDPVSIVRDGVGLYHYDLTLALAGTYYWRFQGLGACVAAEEGYIKVQPSYFSS